MDQHLEVFQDSFRSFYFFGVKKCKNQPFWSKKYCFGVFYQIEVRLFTNWPK